MYCIFQMPESWVFTWQHLMIKLMFKANKNIKKQKLKCVNLVIIVSPKKSLHSRFLNHNPVITSKVGIKQLRFELVGYVRNHNKLINSSHFCFWSTFCRPRVLFFPIIKVIPIFFLGEFPQTNPWFKELIEYFSLFSLHLMACTHCEHPGGWSEKKGKIAYNNERGEPSRERRTL